MQPVLTSPTCIVHVIVQSHFRQVRLALCIAVLLISTVANAAPTLQLASLFSDHMVLQREQPLRVWGTSTPGSSIDVRIDVHRASATADAHGNWMVVLPPIKAGGPYELAVKSGEDSLVLRDVLIGDVWLCAGQSNMQLQLKDSIGGKEAALAAAKLPNLRLLTIPKKPSEKSETSFDARWSPAEEGPAREFSAVAMHFALSLIGKSEATKDVPIGLIDSSFGGTRVEGWVPASALESKFKTEDLHDSIFNIKPTQLYNSMISPIVGANLRGVLWYQGESNAKQSSTYPALMQTMIQQWRSDFRDPGLPFYIVQLPNYPEPWEGVSFAWLRDAQARVAQSVDHVWMAVTIDTPDGYDLHPRHKQLVGERLALLARRNSYGEQIVASGPIFKTATIDGATISVTFDTFGSPLVAKDGKLTGFMLAGADGVYRNATARIDGDDTVVVQSDHVAHPQTVRYAWTADPKASLFNRTGLPTPPFRTDDAAPSLMLEVQPRLTSHRVVTETYAATIEADGQLSSLLVNGQQVLDTDASGGFMPFGAWGQRRLFDCTDIGPNCIRFADGGASVTFTFEPQKIRIDVQNTSPSDALPVRLMLSPLVQQPEPFDPAKPVRFKRDRSSVSISGMNKCEKLFNVVYQLQGDIPANSKRTYEIACSK